MLLGSLYLFTLSQFCKENIVGKPCRVEIFKFPIRYRGMSLREWINGNFAECIDETVVT